MLVAWTKVVPGEGLRRGQIYCVQIVMLMGLVMDWRLGWVGWMAQRGIKDGSEVLGSSSWLGGGDFYGDREDDGSGRRSVRFKVGARGGKATFICRC